MAVYMSKWFKNFAKRNGLDHAKLLEAVRRMERGIVDADLGGGVFKQRISRENQGRAGGYRVIIFFKSGFHSFYVYGYAKNEIANIRADEEKAFKKSALRLLAGSPAEIDALLQAKEIFEVKDDEKIQK